MIAPFCLNHEIYADVPVRGSSLAFALLLLERLELPTSVIDGVFVSDPNLRSSAYRASVLRLFGSKCLVCGYAGFVDIHHVIHRKNGGGDNIENLVVLCANHHREWHYIENTFFGDKGRCVNDAATRANSVLKNMAWELPDMVLSHHIPPFLVRIVQIAEARECL